MNDQQVDKNKNHSQRLGLLDVIPGVRDLPFAWKLTLLVIVMAIVVTVIQLVL